MLDLKSVDMRFMYLTELREKDIYVGDKKMQEGKNICRQAVGGYA